MNRHRPVHDDADCEPVAGPLWLGVSRGIAGFFGALCLLDVARALVVGQTGSDFGWIDLTPCPPAAARGMLAFSGVSLLLFSGTHRLPPAIRPSVIVGAMMLIAVAIANAVSIHRAVGLGEMADGIPMPAHVVTLLVPVIFGIVRGSRYGRLAIPGRAVLLVGTAATAFAFTVGYLSSVSKFHRPVPVDAILVLQPAPGAREAAIDRSSHVVNELLSQGYSSRVIVVQRDGEDKSPEVTRMVSGLLEGTETTTLSVVSDADLVEALAGHPPALMFVGGQHESARVRLLVQQSGRTACFVTTEDSGGPVLSQVRPLWDAWLAPIRSRVLGSFAAEATARLSPVPGDPTRQRWADEGAEE